MRRVAITGASGYIGSLLLAHLIDRAEVERVVGIDLRPPRIASAKLRFYEQDILEPLGPLFAQEEVDAAVHLAFVVRPGHGREQAQKVNVQGAANFLEACLRGPVKHVLYLSSHTVYGAHADNPLPLMEEAPLRPHPGFQYSWDKARAESLFRDFAAAHPHIPVAILRACVVLGPTQDNPVARALLRRVMLRVAGHNPPLQFLHEADLVALMACLMAQSQGGIFNAAGDGVVPYRELAALAQRPSIPVPGSLLRFLLGVTWRLRLQGASPLEGLKFIMYPPVMSTEKLKKEVGLSLRYPSREAALAYIASRFFRP